MYDEIIQTTESHRNLVIFGRILIEKMSTIKIEIKRHWAFSFE